MLHAAEFGEFAEDGGTAEGGEEIGGVTDGGVGGDAGEAITAAAFHGHDEIAEGAGLAGLLVRSGEMEEGVADGGGHHVALGFALLLLVDEQGLFQLRIQRSHLAFEEADLGMLAAEAEDGGTGDVGAVDVSREEAA